MGRRFWVVASAVFVAGCVPLGARTCATCGCTLSTDAATGYTTQSGSRLSLDYTFIDQDQLRHGTGTATPQQVVDQPADPVAGGGEIEKRTINRYTNLSLAYRLNADWGFNLLLPYVLRGHTTYGDQEQPYVPPNSRSSHYLPQVL